MVAGLSPPMIGEETEELYGLREDGAGEFLCK